MEILTVQDVMQLLKVGRATATRVIKQSGYAINKRKGQKLLIEKTALLKSIGGLKSEI